MQNGLVLDYKLNKAVTKDSTFKPSEALKAMYKA